MLKMLSEKINFISFEGIAGSGKTTQIKLLKAYLENRKEKVFISAAYEGVRRLLTSNFMNLSGIKNDDIATMFLFQALHRVQCTEVKESLLSGEFVIADRWRESFIVHHTHWRTFQENQPLIAEIDNLTFENLNPQICIMLDVSPEVAYKRYVDRENELTDNGLNLMDYSYFVKNVENYRQLAKEKKWLLVDGSESVKAVFSKITHYLNKIC